MSRQARPPGGSPGVVVLLVALAITTGWNVPPARPASAVRSAVDRATADDVTTVAPAFSASARTISARRAGTSVAPGGARDGVRTDRSSGDVAHRVRTAPIPDLGPRGNPLAFRGRNHFWIPVLGMSYNVIPFPCPRKRPPDDFIYRWGCAGRNNVYILGHARSVMRALHDAYVQGRLRVGMVAIYADGEGRIRAYQVKEWRVVDAAKGVWWAIADQAVPSMTLQTCVGANEEWRLNVRLVAMD